MSGSHWFLASLIGLFFAGAAQAEPHPDPRYPVRRPDHQQIVEKGGQTIINNYYYGPRPPASLPNRNPQGPQGPQRNYSCSAQCSYTQVTSVIGSYSYIAPAYDRRTKTLRSSVRGSSLQQAEAQAKKNIQKSCVSICHRRVPYVSQYIHQSNRGCRVGALKCR